MDFKTACIIFERNFWCHAAYISLYNHESPLHRLSSSSNWLFFCFLVARTIDWQGWLWISLATITFINSLACECFADADLTKFYCVLFLSPAKSCIFTFDAQIIRYQSTSSPRNLFTWSYKLSQKFHLIIDNGWNILTEP